MHNDMVEIIEIDDSDITWINGVQVGEMVNSYNKDRLYNILSRGTESVSPWSRVCAIEALMKEKPDYVHDTLTALFFSEQPLIRETAARAIREIDTDYYQRLLKRLPTKQAEQIFEVIPVEKDSQKNQYLSGFQKVLLMKQTPLLSEVSEIVLAEMVDDVQDLFLGAEQNLFEEGDEGNTMYIVVNGVIRAHRGDQVFARMKRGTLLGEIAAVETGFRTLSITADEPSHLLVLHRDTLLNLMTEHLEIIPIITRVIASRRARG